MSSVIQKRDWYKFRILYFGGGGLILQFKGDGGLVIDIDVLGVLLGEIICFIDFDELFLLVLVFLKYGVLVNVFDGLVVIFLDEVMVLNNLVFVEKLIYNGVNLCVVGKERELIIY